MENELSNNSPPSTFYKCIYCKFKSSNANEVTGHSVQHHRYNLLKIEAPHIDPVTGRIGFLTQNFGIIPNEIIKPNETFKLKDDTWEIFIVKHVDHESRFAAHLGDCLTNTRIVEKKRRQYLEQVESEFIDADDLFDSLVAEIVELVPSVLVKMRDEGHLDDWIRMNRMVASGTFPFENIAFLLFMDVCKFFDTGNTSSMRYNDTVKKFWRIGYRLFHRKWLKFMSGAKHMGKLLTNDCERGVFSSLDGSINFAVPERKIVSSQLSPVNPSEIILPTLLDKLASQSSETKTYKICLDGKKINAATDGKYGDIDLWGFEAKPTLEERQQQLDAEIKDIGIAMDIIKLSITKHKHYLLEVNIEDQKLLKEKLIQIVTVLSNGTKTLRETVVRKQMMKERLQNTVDGDWRKSKLVFVISALLTTLFDVKACIRHLLASTDNLCSLIAILNHANYTRDGLVHLQYQTNYVYLVGDSITTENQQDYRNMKQLSEQWHMLRKTAMSTGSTLNAAIELSTLKEQLQHFDEKLFQKPRPEFSPTAKERMNYGKAMK